MQVVHPVERWGVVPVPIEPAADLAFLVAGANGRGGWLARLLARRDPDRSRDGEDEDDSFERRAQELI